MSRRKNTKRIDPRYFLNETVNRNQDESAVEEGIMDDVERAQRGEIPPEQAAQIKDAEDAMKTRAGDPDRHADWGQAEEEEELEEQETPEE
jgi:hypothetical protein